MFACCTRQVAIPSRSLLATLSASSVPRQTGSSCMPNVLRVGIHQANLLTIERASAMPMPANTRRQDSYSRFSAEPRNAHSPLRLAADLIALLAERMIHVRFRAAASERAGSSWEVRVAMRLHAGPQQRLWFREAWMQCGPVLHRQACGWGRTPRSKSDRLSPADSARYLSS